jgi:hypothetical protein
MRASDIQNSIAEGATGQAKAPALGLRWVCAEGKLRSNRRPERISRRFERLVAPRGPMKPRLDTGPERCPFL